VAVDDATRLAYAEELADERAETAAAFLERALAFFAIHGIQVRRLLSDNGSCYRSHLFAAACAERGLVHWYTQPYRPQTNGKAEAFVKIVQKGWAYRRPYDSTAERINALPRFLAYYHGYRPHGGLDGDTPLSRLRTTTS
jgi:transposase InsO family protein